MSGPAAEVNLVPSGVRIMGVRVANHAAVGQHVLVFVLVRILMRFAFDSRLAASASASRAHQTLPDR
jgi:hypothetical protein